MHACSFVVRLVYVLAGAVLAAVSCFFLLPLLSSVLWLRGLWTVVQYVQQVKRADGAWGRLQGKENAVRYHWQIVAYVCATPRRSAYLQNYRP